MITAASVTPVSAQAKLEKLRIVTPPAPLPIRALRRQGGGILRRGGIDAEIIHTSGSIAPMHGSQ